ncbi:MAG: hypothetical protein ACYCSN_18520, partial [Acidobacteriaceae bacterium]
VNRTGALVLNPLARRAALTHRTGDLCLDKPFDLIEGHPAPGLEGVGLGEIAPMSQKRDMGHPASLLNDKQESGQRQRPGPGLGQRQTATARAGYGWRG